MVAAPAGMLIWVMANLTLDGQTLLTRSAAFLDPAARFFGLDGVILLAFILGFPANEIVVPIIIMAYLSTGSLVEMNDLSALHTLLVQNGWTWVTAVCTMLFSLMHWPCSTTCLTIRKESQSWKWTAAAFALPTAAGLASCALVANGARLVGRLLGGEHVRASIFLIDDGHSCAERADYRLTGMRDESETYIKNTIPLQIFKAGRPML